MNLEVEIQKENSRKHWERMTAWVGKDPQRFQEMLSMMMSDNKRLSQLSSQIITTLADFTPELFSDTVKTELIRNLKKNPGDSVKRNTIRIFQFLDAPEDAEGELFDLGISYLKSAEEPIAVKAFAMTALRKICEKYPELAAELVPQIEILVGEKISSGLLNRAKKELQKLALLSKK